MKTVLIILLSLGSFSICIAQNETEKKEKNTEESLEREIVDELDEELGKLEEFIFGKDKKKDKSSESKNTEKTKSEESSSLFGGANVESSYHFDFQLKSELKEYKKNGKLKSEYTYDMYLNKDQPYLGMMPEKEKKGDIEMVITDAKNQSVITLMNNDGKKQSLAVKTKRLTKIFEEESTEENDITLKATGKTKTVAGYLCHQYIMDSKDGNADVWITKDLPIDTRLFMHGMNERSKNKLVYPHFQGFMLEHTYTDKKNGRQYIMIVKDVITIDKNIKTDDYPRGLGF